jgi:hypothetical protein
VVPARYGRQANCFETVVAGLAPGYTVLQSGSFFVQTPFVAFAMIETLVATGLRPLLQINSIASIYNLVSNRTGSNHLRLYGQASRAISTG